MELGADTALLGQCQQGSESKGDTAAATALNAGSKIDLRRLKKVGERTGRERKMRVGER